MNPSIMFQSRRSILRMISFCLIASVGYVTANAHNPIVFMEVVSGKPSNMIEHGIEAKAIVDKERSEINLEGPYHFSLSVGAMGRKVKEPKSYLAWYKIADAPQDAPRKVSCIDLVRGEESKPMKIGSAEYFLSPAQRITSGPPSDIPEGLDLYKAYRVLDEAPRELDITLTGGVSDGKRRVGKPIFVCFPTEEWHHEEYTRATHRRAGFVVYELDEQTKDAKFTLIDQFGLNQMGTSKSRWICVPATVSPRIIE